MRTLRYFATEQRTPPPLDAYQGRKRVAMLLQALTHLPVVYNAAAMKRSVRASLSLVLGISKSHIAKGGLATLKPKMQAKAQASALAYAKAQALKNGWPQAEFEAVQASIPRLANGNAAPWASWVHVIQNIDCAPLPLTVALALERDEFVDVLVQALIDDDPTAFRDAVLEAIVEDITEDPTNADFDLLDAWDGLVTWEEIKDPFQSLTQVLMVDFIAALDAEWGARYLASLEPQPIFLWVAPRMNPKTSEVTEAQRRNAIFRPVRRLLELAHALLEHAYLGKWPKAPPGRMAISADAGLEDYIVGDLFDGTRRLGFEEFQDYWLEMCRQPRFQRKRKGFMFLPSVLAYVAIAFEATLVETGRGMKLLSAILLDEVDYRGRWSYRRERWKQQLAEANDASKPLQPWPEWLLSQSILPPGSAA